MPQKNGIIVHAFGDKAIEFGGFSIDWVGDFSIWFGDDKIVLFIYIFGGLVIEMWWYLIYFGYE